MDERGRVLAVSNGSVWSLGWLTSWLAECGLAVDVLRPYEGDRLPVRVGQDALIVLPGSVGVYQDDRAPWLAPVRAMLGNAVHSGLPTLGICFGAQLMATVCGGKVSHVDGVGEFGVHRIRRIGAPDPLFDGLPAEARVTLWHDEAVTDLPDGAVALAENDVCLQGYRIGERAWGIQFHPEATLTGVRRWSRLYAETLYSLGFGARDKAEEFSALHAELTAVWRPFVHRFAAAVGS